jgi:membrane protease YdiL (CAAX protease family)
MDLRLHGSEREWIESGSALRRRRIAVVAALCVGAVLLGIALALHPGSAGFYPATVAVAVVWVLGAVASGPVHLGRVAMRGPWEALGIPFLLGLGAAAVFVLGALVAREIPPIRSSTDDVLQHARALSLPLVAGVTVLNGIAEELFFRGAAYAAFGARWPIVGSTVLYAAATAATGSPMLVFAGVVLGFVWALQRRATGGVLAGAVSHVTWSLAMLFVLPPLFR